MYKDAKFWDKISKKYYKRPITDQKTYEHKLQKSREYFKPDMTALEIGCGSGGTALLHAPYLKHIRAVDFSEKMIEFALSRPEYEGVENVSFEVASIDELQIDDGSLDVIFTLSLLHLLEDPQTVISKIYSWLKPGGIFISSTACILDIAKIIKYIGPIGYKLGFIPKLSYFTANELVDYISKPGFRVDYKFMPEPKKKGGSDALFVIAIK